MSIFVRRQYAAACGQGSHSTLPDCTIFPYRFTDVNPRNTLNLEDDKFTSDYTALTANTSFSIPVPDGYSSANKLGVILRATAITKVVIVDPSALGTSTFLIKATSGTTKGNHPGILAWSGRVTSITVSVPSAFDTSLVQWFLYEIPDLTLASSWKNGYQTLGVVP